MSSIRIQKDINDKRKRSLILLGIITCVCLALCVIGYVSEDRTPPKLDFTYAVAYLDYSDENPLTENSFLTGVTAIDSKDGDLTKNIIVSSLVYGEGNKNVTISYCVRDYDGNIATAQRIYNLNDGKASVFATDTAESSAASESSAPVTSEEAVTTIKSTEEETTSLVEESTEETEADSQTAESIPAESTEASEAPVIESSSDEMPSEEISSSEPLPSEESLTAEGEQPVQESISEEVPPIATETALPVDTSSNPVILLTESEVYLQAGSSFDYSLYIAQLYDDVDDYYTLYAQVWVENLDLVNLNLPGEYEVRYHVKDSDGNFSEAQILTIYIY